MTTLYLIRGLPGSGKSTWAQKNCNYFRDIHLETDMYFMKNGKYCFDGSKIKEAHEWCFQTTKIFLNNNINVIVSNTFTQIWEMQKYIDLGFSFHVFRMTNNFGNIHNVPSHVIDNMKNRFQDFDGEVLIDLNEIPIFANS